MWLFTKNGFASIVKDNQRRATKPGRGAEWLLLRCRLKRHIVAFEKLLKQIGWSGRHDHAPHRDYHWRLSLTRDQLCKLMVICADDLDYDNFKGRCHQDGDQMQDAAYSRVWSIMHSLQMDEANPRPKPIKSKGLFR